ACKRSKAGAETRCIYRPSYPICMQDWEKRVFETLSWEQRDATALITLSRPERLNAYNTRMMLDLVAALDRADADDAIGCVVITGAGRAFCSGADISAGGDAFARLGDDPGREALRHGDLFRDGGGYASLRIFESRKPVIAAINGAAVGVGRSEEHTSELQSRENLVCRLLPEK